MPVAQKTPKILIRDVETGEEKGAKSVAQALLFVNEIISKEKIGKKATTYGINMAISRGDVIHGRIKVMRKGKAANANKASSQVIPKGKRKLRIKKRPTEEGETPAEKRAKKAPPSGSKGPAPGIPTKAIAQAPDKIADDVVAAMDEQRKALAKQNPIPAATAPEPRRPEDLAQNPLKYSTDKDRLPAIKPPAVAGEAPHPFQNLLDREKEMQGVAKKTVPKDEQKEYIQLPASEVRNFDRIKYMQQFKKTQEDYNKLIGAHLEKARAVETPESREDALNAVAGPGDKFYTMRIFSPTRGSMVLYQGSEDDLNDAQILLKSGIVPVEDTGTLVNFIEAHKEMVQSRAVERENALQQRLIEEGMTKEEEARAQKELKRQEEELRRQSQEQQEEFIRRANEALSTAREQGQAPSTETLVQLAVANAVRRERLEKTDQAVQEEDEKEVEEAAAEDGAITVQDGDSVEEIFAPDMMSVVSAAKQIIDVEFESDLRRYASRLRALRTQYAGKRTIAEIVEHMTIIAQSMSKFATMLNEKALEGTDGSYLAAAAATFDVPTNEYNFLKLLYDGKNLINARMKSGSKLSDAVNEIDKYNAGVHNFAIDLADLTATLDRTIEPATYRIPFFEEQELIDIFTIDIVEGEDMTLVSNPGGEDALVTAEANDEAIVEANEDQQQGKLEDMSLAEGQAEEPAEEPVGPQTGLMTIEEGDEEEGDTSTMSVVDQAPAEAAADEGSVASVETVQTQITTLKDQAKAAEERIKDAQTEEELTAAQAENERLAKENSRLIKELNQARQMQTIAEDEAEEAADELAQTNEILERSRESLSRRRPEGQTEELEDEQERGKRTRTEPTGEGMIGKGLLDSAYREGDEVGAPYVTTSDDIDLEIKALTFSRPRHLQADVMDEDPIPAFSRTRAFKNFRRTVDEDAGPGNRATSEVPIEEGRRQGGYRRGGLFSQAGRASFARPTRVQSTNLDGNPTAGQQPVYDLTLDPTDPTKYNYTKRETPFEQKPVAEALRDFLKREQDFAKVKPEPRETPFGAKAEPKEEGVKQEGGPATEEKEGVEDNVEGPQEGSAAEEDELGGLGMLGEGILVLGRRGMKRGRGGKGIATRRHIHASC